MDDKLFFVKNKTHFPGISICFLHFLSYKSIILIFPTTEYVDMKTEMVIFSVI